MACVQGLCTCNTHGKGECNYEACKDSYIVACVQGVCTCNTHGKGELIMKRIRTPT